MGTPMFSRITMALAGVLGLWTLAFDAHANVINLGAQVGTLTCTGSTSPACAGFTGQGTTSTTSATAMTLANSGDQTEITRLNFLINTGTFTTGDLTKGPVSGSPLTGTFSVSSPYFIVKLGSGLDKFFFFQNLDSTLTLTFNLIAGAGNGISHIDTVPLPGAAVLFFTALGGLIGWRRWRQSDDAEATLQAA